MKRLITVIGILLTLLAGPSWAVEPINLALAPAILGGAGAGVAAANEGTFGHDNIESSSGAASNGGIRCAGLDTPANSGTVDKIQIYSSNTTEALNVKVGLYVVSAGDMTTKVGTETTLSSVGTWSLGWHDFSVSYSVTAGTYYVMCFQPDDSGMTIYSIDNGSTVRFFYISHTYADAWASPETGEAGFTFDGSFKAHYTY